MSADPRFQEAIDAGERNAAGFIRVKNWCAHVRIERRGGIGMVEQMTGLPIGAHGLACDHAPAGGPASWDIRDAALDFHNRYCRGCTLRQPVSIPNILEWVTEQDAAVAKQRAAEAETARQAADALARRQAERDTLRAGLVPVAADVIDQIAELDAQRSAVLADTLVQTAKLAPHAFPPPVIEHVFRLLEADEYWFADAGLRVLDALDADTGRLARCAMMCLERPSSVWTAASVLFPRMHLGDETLIPGVLPAIIRMASPPGGFGPPRPPKIAMLVRIHEVFPEQVVAAIDALLDGQPGDVSLAACAVKVLARRQPAVAARFARDLIAKLVRSSWLPDPDNPGHDPHTSIGRELEDAVVAAFQCDPNAVDSLLEKFRPGASPLGETRIFSVYSRVLHTQRFAAWRRQDRADPQKCGDAQRLAFRRLLWEAPKTKNRRVLRVIQRVIRGDPDELLDLVKDEVTNLLGAAIQMDDRISRFDTDEVPANANPVQALDWSNRRSTLDGLRSSFVSWAARAAAAADDSASYLHVLQNLPEDKEELAGSMIEKSVVLMETATGLNAVLPTLYTALVGMSVARRGAAAHAIGKIPYRQRENIPELLFEAFVTTLSDREAYVYRSALLALDDIRLPTTFDLRICEALTGIMQAYARRVDGDAIALACIELFATRYLQPEELAGDEGSYLVRLLELMSPVLASRHFRHIARKLSSAPGFIDLLLSYLRADEAREFLEEDVLEVLAELPTDLVHAYRQELSAIPVTEEPDTQRRALHVVEILTRARAWAEAEQLSATALAAIPDTVREAPRRRLFELANIAAAFEHALAVGDHARAKAQSTRWREVRAKEADDRERVQRADPLRHVHGAAGGP